MAQAVERIRKQTPILSTAVFNSLDMLKDHPIAEEKITPMSDYFLVETNVAIENQHAVIYTLLKRSKTSDKMAVDMVWQSKGVW